MDFLADMFTELCELIYRAVADILSWVLALLGEWDWVALSDEIYYAAVPFVPQFQVVVAASYALMIVVGGFIIMSQEALQTRYSIREIAPRLIVGFVLSGLAVTICYEAFRINWSIVGAFLDTPAGSIPEAGAETEEFEEEFSQLGWSEEMTAADFLLATVYKLVCIVAVAILLVTTILRNIAWFFVVALSPAALACHGLPVTERFAVYWWRMLGACLASSIGQAILIWIYLEMTGSLYFGMINDIVPMDGVYAVVLVWMMWRLHIECFKIARGRPISIPGSRMLAAFVMSKAAGAGHGRKRDISVSDSAWGRKMQAPWHKRGNSGDTAPDRFPDLPPEPEGFADWADFRNDVDARQEASPPRPVALVNSPPAPADGPVSPLADAGPVGVDGQPKVGGSNGPSGRGEAQKPRPNPRAGAPVSPMDDAAPSDDATAAATKPNWANDPLTAVPDGTLLPRKEPEPMPVMVRADEVEMLRSRQNVAELERWEQQSEQAEREAQARAEATQRQAELRQAAAAAMARMAAAPGAPVPTTSAQADQLPPAPKVQRRGER